MKRLPHDSLPRDEFFRKKSLSLKYVSLSLFGMSLFGRVRLGGNRSGVGCLFGEGFGSRDAGFELFHRGQNPSYGGGFNLASKGSEIKFHYSNDVAVAVMQGRCDHGCSRVLTKISLILFVNFSYRLAGL